jgi:hypothetical protein
MHKAQALTNITVTTTAEVRRQLEQWAQDNLSSLSAGATRAIRERATREGREIASIAGSITDLRTDMA